MVLAHIAGVDQDPVATHCDLVSLLLLRRVGAGVLLLSPDFNQVRRWAMIEMGLENIHGKYS
jgi:hypothetical protein